MRPGRGSGGEKERERERERCEWGLFLVSFVRGYWECAAECGSIVMTGVTIMELNFQ